MGPERRSMVMHEDEKRATAYHESGHAIVAESLPFTDPVHKVTIMPRGRALGLTWQLPERDRISMYKDQMLSQLSILFGGRIAEDIFVGRISTGASNDFERATQMAREMVTRYGMSDKMGVMVYAENEGEVFLGRSVTRSQNISEKTQQDIDAEIRRILDEQYQIAYKILDENRDKMETMCKALMEWKPSTAIRYWKSWRANNPVRPRITATTCARMRTRRKITRRTLRLGKKPKHLPRQTPLRQSPSSSLKTRLNFPNKRQPASCRFPILFSDGIFRSMPSETPKPYRFLRICDMAV